MALKKSIEIPANKITYKIIKGKKFAVGKYLKNGKTYEAYRIIGKA